MFTVMLQMSLLIAIGWLWQHVAPKHISALSHRRALTDLVFYILLPALVLNVIWTAPLDANTAKISLTALSRLVTALLLMWLCCQFLSITRPQQGALLLAAAFPNATNLGLPVALEVFGDWTQVVVLNFDLFAFTPVLFTFGMLLAQHYGDAKVKVHPLCELVKVPPLWALLIASAMNLMEIPQPQMLQHALVALGNGVVPLMLIALGMSLRWDTLKPQFPPMILAVCVIGLLVAPFAAQQVATILNLPAETLKAVVLLSAMPSMVFGVIVCERYQLDSALYAATVLVSSVLSILSLSAWYYYLQH
jgi:predicted permease